MNARNLIPGALALSLVLLTGGCATQQYLTGEPVVYGIRNSTGEIIDRDIVTDGPAIHKGEIVTVVANSVFIKFLEDHANPDVLVYAEVYDEGTDDPDKAFRHVIYKGENTPAGVLLGVSDKVIYGPTPFKGFPLRIKFFIVELDKDQKKQASQLINAVGAVAQSASPQYATAVGVVMQVAQAINQLNEDDFELRFDLTLYPVAPASPYAIANDDLEKAKEPKGRYNQKIHLVTPLRSGSYAVLKRELPNRFSTSAAKDPALSNSSLLLDPAQEGFIQEYKGYGTDKKTYSAIELLRYQGGYLYNVIAGIRDGTNNVAGATVVDPANPGNATSLVPGIRQFYRERTHATFTVLTGLPEGLDDAAMRTTSNKQLEQIRNLLDNPDQVPTSTRLAPFIDNVAASLATAIQQRRIANQAAHRVGVDPAFRTGPAYPVYWLQNLEQLDEDKAENDRRVAKNVALLNTVSEIVLNMPVVSGEKTNCLAAMKSLETGDFESLTNHPGYFNLTTNGLAKLNTCR